ncbi:amidophosphoribosyltransferase [Egibacter rhizosphaerae]|uniref:Amidophosphoribosyltransferase n=1 Tax=Egibacter rhizosphaerae TaxID=1670831 RepID=A0A411YG41_9ACTN|nr:amidophosphoribosyltransferase [Egibacter rhizosphaerae]QBI20183.1 amidophosphoribosyltransferase [Egibacter rhizosphaerae]
MAATTGARDECGVVAVSAPGEEVARLCYYALYALQHRGQESAGIAVSEGARLLVSREMGLVSQAFDEARLAGLPGDRGIGHVRYSTSGTSSWDNAQPAFTVAGSGAGVALAHNGNLTNTEALAGSGGRTRACGTDSQLLATLLAERLDEGGLEAATADVCSEAMGAYSLVALTEDAIVGARDPHGVRPLVVGRLPAGGYVLASETVALDILGAHLIREVAPGEVVTVDRHGLRTRRFASAHPAFCAFEYVYLARPDHVEPAADGSTTSVAAARRRLGQALAEEAPADADLVVPVPDSGTAAAAGYAQASGIPYAEGLVKNRYVGRTFIEPSPSLRQLGVRLKLNPLRDVIAGQRLVVVDDSIVRGNTSRQLMAMLREAGAREIHLRVTSPPIRHPCFYGVDMATPTELIGSGLTIDEIRAFVGADSLAYLPQERLVEATRRPGDALCTACFDGRYPIPIPDEPALAQASLFTDLSPGTSVAAPAPPHVEGSDA